MTNKIITIIFIVLLSVPLKGQSIDSVSFRKAAISSILKYVEANKGGENFKYDIDYADTSRIKLYIPVLMLKSPDPPEMDNQTLHSYISEIFDPLLQEVIIEKKEGIYVLNLLKKKYNYDKKSKINKKRKFETGCNDYIISFYNYKDKEEYQSESMGQHFKLLINYAFANPESIVFRISGLPEFWSLKNNKIIRLIIHDDRVDEIDGEEYYRSVLLPISPKGIEQVINGGCFLPTVVE